MVSRKGQTYFLISQTHTMVPIQMIPHKLDQLEIVICINKVHSQRSKLESNSAINKIISLKLSKNKSYFTND